MRAVPSDRYWQVPAIERRDRLVGGVSAGIASELGLDVFWVRLAFVALFTAGGWGALLYAVVWGWLAIDQYVHQRPEVARIPKARNGRERLVGFALATLGGYALFERLFGLPNWLVWPLGLLALGIIVLWQRRRPNASAKPIARPIQVAQTVGGLVLIGTAVLLLVRPFSDWAQASAGLVIGVGIGGAPRVLGAVVVATSGRPRRRTPGSGPIRGAGRGGRPHPRLGAADPVADPTPLRRSPEDGRTRPPAGT
ncbi:MAG: PspC domain-containing protein [Acidimicrobiales bacterium]